MSSDGMLAELRDRWEDSAATGAGGQGTPTAWATVAAGTTTSDLSGLVGEGVYLVVHGNRGHGKSYRVSPERKAVPEDVFIGSSRSPAARLMSRRGAGLEEAVRVALGIARRRGDAHMHPLPFGMAAPIATAERPAELVAFMRVLEDASGAALGFEDFASRESQVKQRHADPRLLGELLRLLQDEPIEDGRTHPGEAMLRSVAAGGAAEIDAWCLTAIDGSLGGTRVASMLRLLSRVGLPRGAEARRCAVEVGLKHEVAEVRDAAIQCVETWEDRGLRDLLLGHRDPIPWLVQYACQVAADLEG